MPHSNPNFYDAIVAGISSSQDHWASGHFPSSYVQHVAQIIYNGISPSTSTNLDAESELLQSIVGGLFAGNPLIPSLDPTYVNIASAINTLFQQLRGSLDNTSSAGGIATGLQTSALIPVDVAGAAPPAIGQVLIATSSTSATWQNSGAGVTLATTTPAAEVVGGAGVVGVGTTAARDDHRHSLPAFGTTAGTFCQGNDSRFVSISGSTPASEVVGGSGSAGSTGQASDAGHVHALPAFGTSSGTFCQGSDSRLSNDRTASGIRTASTVVAVGSATAPSAGQVLTASSSTAAAWSTPSSGAPLTTNAPANVTKATAAVGVGTAAARDDHKHDVSTATAGAAAPGDSASEGTATTLARSDHKHSLPAFGTSSGTFCQGNDSRFISISGSTPASEVVGGAGVVGSTGQASDAGHVHPLPAFGTTAGTFCQGNDSRFISISGSTPASEVVGGSGSAGSTGQASDAGHIHPLPAFGTSSGTFCQGNDSRLSDDRTASGIRSATTVVSVSSATAPSAGQVLTASSSTAAAWATPSGGGGGTFPGTYTYATLPSAVTAGVGNQQIVSDVPDCVFISDGSVWQPFCSGVLVTPPSVPVSSLTAYNPNAGSVLTQEGPFWRLTTSEALNNVLRAWLVGPIAKDGSGQYYIEMGIDSADSMMMVPFGTLGIYADDSVSQGCTWFWYTQPTASQGMSSHYFSPTPSYSSSASTTPAGLAKPIRFIRYGYATGVYSIDLSVDGVRWVRVFMGGGWNQGFGAPATLTQYGIAIDNAINYTNGVSSGTSRVYARICHMLQVAAPPPAPIL